MCENSSIQCAHLYGAKILQKYVNDCFLNAFFNSIVKYAFRRCYGYLWNSIIEDIGRETYIETALAQRQHCFVKAL